MGYNFLFEKQKVINLPNAFEQLKGGWQLLYKKSEVNQYSFKVNVLTCFVIHNICIEKRNSISHKLDLSYDKMTIQENLRKN